MMENWFLKSCLVPGALMITLAIISDNPVSADARFKSRPTTIKTFENDSVLLPCYSTDHASRIRWINEDGVVIADNLLPNIQTPDKFLNSNGSLEVINVQLNDTGNYNCEVTVGYRVFSQAHAIEVQVPPEVITYPMGFMNVTLGAIFQITCEPKGVPYPMISWRHNMQTVTNTDDNTNRRLTVEVKHYDMAGLIECIADNGVGEPVSNGIVMLVHFKPEVVVKTPIVHTKVGIKATIECIVLSYPKAQIHWFHNSKPVMKYNNNVIIKENDLTVTEALSSYYTKRIHSLIIRNVRDTDFGKYECKVENSQGLSSAFIQLTGIPQKPFFENKSQPATPETKVLSWQTKSFAPVLDYKFRFRRVQTGNENFIRGHFEWKPLTIPADKDTTGPFHTKSYKLIGLKPSSVYEVVIAARNQYGVSDDSNALRFSTPAVTDIISSSSTESIFNEYDSHFDDDLRNEIYATSYYNAASAGNTATLTMVIMSFAFVTFFFCISAVNRK